MKLHQKISNAIEEVYLSGLYKELIGGKDTSPQYLEWKEKFQSKKLLGHSLASDTVGQNLGLTHILINLDSIKTEQVNVVHHFFIQKSMVSDFVTFYGTVNYNSFYGKDGIIRAASFAVVSPVGPFNRFFPAAWEMMKSNYPDCTYLCHSHLMMNYEILNGEKKNLYELFFGYESTLLSSKTFGDVYYQPEK